ncbi:hypothetical protein [Phytoactinopolyspora endophytica]|uniref:hypothetical protein n=1 Tax=Phytoactinopolyspora endophytica TaxID=1642495 RepID=UPI00101D1FB5|nr:hypothetical protein [Phytoactinopolyspora endophytica]
MSTSLDSRARTASPSAVPSASQGRSSSRLPGAPRRSVAHLSLGILLVVGCVTAFVVMSTRMDERAPVLALAEPVTVGDVLTPADLREVNVAVDAGVAVVDASRARSVVGTRMAISAPAGTLLTSGMLGDTVLPGSGEAIVAVALAPGAFPPETTPGAHVHVVPSAAPGENSTVEEPESSWSAVVVGVHPTTVEATTVVSLQVDEQAAAQIAAVASVRIVVISGGG